MLNVALRSEYFQYANPPYRAQMPADKTVMTTAFRCRPKEKSRRVPSNKHRNAAAPPITLKTKSTQLSIMASADLPQADRRSNRHRVSSRMERNVAKLHTAPRVHVTPLVPGAGFEPARRNYPSRDFKSLVSTSFTTRALRGGLCQKETGKALPSSPLEAGVGIEPASTALQVENASMLINDLQ